MAVLRAGALSLVAVLFLSTCEVQARFRGEGPSSTPCNDAEADSITLPLLLYSRANYPHFRVRISA